MVSLELFSDTWSVKSWASVLSLRTLSFMMKLLFFCQLFALTECLEWFFQPNLKQNNSELIRAHSQLSSSRFAAKNGDGDGAQTKLNSHKIRGRSLEQLPDSKNSRISRQLTYNFQPFNSFNGLSRSFPFQSPSNTYCKILKQNWK